MELINPAALEMAEVERDASGLPRAWPLLHVGDNVITRSAGMPVNLKLGKADLEAIVAYHKSKGVQIPLDSEHVVSNLAGKLGIDEADLLAKLPRYAGVAGFGRLELRGDTLYLADADYLPIGREVLAAGQFRYFSPSVRGLDGKSPIRVTSVALTNTPHLQNIPALTAGETDDKEDETMTPATVAAAIASLKRKEADMPDDPTKKTEEGAAQTTAQTPPQTPPKNPPETPPKADDGELLKLIREVLGPDVTAENLRVRLAALKTTSEGAVELAERVQRLERSTEAQSLADARKDALAHGKLTPALLERDYFKNMTAAELSDYCAAVPDGCAAPVGTLELGGDRPPTRGKSSAPQKFNSTAEAIKAAEITDLKGA